MTVKNIGTHTSHCCALHGCKYGSEECPVELKTLVQDNLCEYCPNSVYDAEHLVLLAENAVVAANDELIFVRSIVEKNKK